MGGWIEVKRGSALATYLHPERLNLLLVRHAQPGPGPGATASGGYPLTPLGQKQATRLAARLAPLPITHLYVSDLLRAQQTAEPLRALCPELPCVICRDLREVSAFHDPAMPLAGNDEEQRVCTKELAAVGRFAARCRKKHGPGDVVVVIAHGNVNWLLFNLLAGISPRASLNVSRYHTSVTVATLDPSGPVYLELLNCTRHLRASIIHTENIR